MKTKLSTLLLAIALCAVALPAHAYEKQVLFATANVTVTQTVGTFGLSAGTRYAMLTYTTTNCASCNHQVQIEMQDGDGTWVLFDAAAAETTNVTRRMLFSGTALAFGANSTAITALIQKPFPTIFRLTIVRAGGTGNVDVAVSLASW